MFVEGLFNLLKGDPNVSATVGTSRSDASSGIFPDVAPDETVMPYVVFSQIHREAVPVYAGVNRFQFIRIELACFASTFEIARRLGNDVKNLLDGFTGQLSDGSFVGNTIPNSEHDAYEPAGKNTIFGVVLDYTFSVVDNDVTNL